MCRVTGDVPTLVKGEPEDDELVKGEPEDDALVKGEPEDDEGATADAETDVDVAAEVGGVLDTAVVLDAVCAVDPLEEQAATNPIPMTASPTAPTTGALSGAFICISSCSGWGGHSLGTTPSLGDSRSSCDTHSS